MGTQKNHLNEMVLLSTQNICYKLWIRKYSQFYSKNFCLSIPVVTTRESLTNLTQSIKTECNIYSFHTSGNFCPLLITLAFSLDSPCTVFFPCISYLESHLHITIIIHIETSYSKYKCSELVSLNGLYCIWNKNHPRTSSLFSALCIMCHIVLYLKFSKSSRYAQRCFPKLAQLIDDQHCSKKVLHK